MACSDLRQAQQMAEQERLTQSHWLSPWSGATSPRLRAAIFSAIFQRDMPEQRDMPDSAAEPVHESAEFGQSGAQ
ncbi:hypothetical protein P353_02095 [Comamonas testosteroni]|uniref:Uncharacterized protein n=1 Tax=Comamonas testosteroni TaxID=285 RepID=A0A096FPZ5_COMTE|nr:hypothetical protein P353_02095 [Comamonas testosteroni]